MKSTLLPFFFLLFNLLQLHSQATTFACDENASAQLKKYQTRFSTMSNYRDSVTVQCKQYVNARSFVENGLAIAKSESACTLLAEYEKTSAVLDEFKAACLTYIPDYGYAKKNAYNEIRDAYKSAQRTVEGGNFAYNLTDSEYLKKGAYYTWIIYVAKTDTDTAATNILKKYLEVEQQLKDWTAANEIKLNEAKITKAKTMALPKDLYTGADLATLKKKVTDLFASECPTASKKYKIHKVYITKDSWNRKKGEKWDDGMKAYVDFDKSSIYVDVIFVSKENPTAEYAFLVQYTLFKNNISGSYSTDLLGDFIEDKWIQYSRVK